MTTGTMGAGTSEYTVASVMNRLFVAILTPPDAQSAQVALAADIDALVTDITVGDFTIREDEALLRQGSILELGQELVRVVSYDAITSTVSVTRGEYGTVPAAHLVPLLMNLNPVYTRATVFESVADNIITLYPRLFTTSQEYISTVSAGIFPMTDDLAVEVLSAWADGWTGSTDIMAEIVDFHQLTGGRSVITNHATAGALWFRYRRRMGKATSEADTLVSLGVDERWVNIVMLGTAADLLAGRDLTAAQTEWVKSVLEAENIRVGSRMSIAGGLYQLRNMRLDDASAEMKAEYKTRVHMRNPMKVIV